MGSGASRPPFPSDRDHPELVMANDAINQKYSAVSDILGVPIDEMHYSVAEGVILRHFERGIIYWTRMTDAHEVHGAILDHYRDFGAENSLLGVPTTDETATSDGVGRFNHFVNGSIYWSPETGAHEIHGHIHAHWASLGSETSYLGYPISEEHEWFEPATLLPGRVSDFQFGRIGWTQERGTSEWPETRALDSGPVAFPDSTPVHGWIQIIIMSNGHFRFKFHIHSDGASPYHFCTIGAVGSDSTEDRPGFGERAAVFGLRHTGLIQGIEAEDRSNEVMGEGDSVLLREAWPWMRNGHFRAAISVQDNMSDAFSGATESIRSFLRELYGADPGEQLGGPTSGFKSDIRDL